MFPYQFLTKGKYWSRYKSNILYGIAIHTSSKQFTIAIVIRLTHRSVLMVVGGKVESL